MLWNGHRVSLTSGSLVTAFPSLLRGYIRPIVRGKSCCNVEFGAKISISITGDGFTFLNRLSFDPYNEGEDLKAQVLPIAGVMGIILPLFEPIKFIGHAVFVRSVQVIRSG